MAKFNVKDTRAATRGPIESERTPSGRTYEGAPGYARTEKSELFLLAVTNMVGEKTFYESADARDERYEKLVRQVAVADPEWFLSFVTWLRAQGNMRTASLVAAAQGVHAKLADDKRGARDNLGYNRKIINAVLQRADEPGEMLAYWTSTFGRKIPKPVKRGVADAVKRLYTERNYLKWDSESKGYRFADVIDLTHPDAQALWQGALYEHILDKRHGHAQTLDPNTSLKMVLANQLLRGCGQASDWLDPVKLADAGMTWEDALSAVGSKVDKRKLWEAIIPSMGYMALLRNLRNFDTAGISREAAQKVIDKLTDPEEIVKSKQFPFRFLAAYNATRTNLRWAYPLELALNGSMGNIPVLKGRTLVLVDRSGSMFGPISEKSGLNRADTAALFGAALALRNFGNVDLVRFGSGSQAMSLVAGQSLLPLINQFGGSMGGTETASAVRIHYNRHDRVVIITDEQATGATPTNVIPANIPVYTWNLAGYKYGHGPSGNNRYTFGGLTDAAFLQMQLLESGRDAKWPWENE